MGSVGWEWTSLGWNHTRCAAATAAAAAACPTISTFVRDRPAIRRGGALTTCSTAHCAAYVRLVARRAPEPCLLLLTRAPTAAAATAAAARRTASACQTFAPCRRATRARRASCWRPPSAARSPGAASCRRPPAGIPARPRPPQSLLPLQPKSPSVRRRRPLLCPPSTSASLTFPSRCAAAWLAKRVTQSSPPPPANPPANPPRARPPLHPPCRWCSGYLPTCRCASSPVSGCSQRTRRPWPPSPGGPRCQRLAWSTAMRRGPWRCER